MPATAVMPTCVGGEIHLPDYHHATAPISNWDAVRHPMLLAAGGCLCHQAVLMRHSGLAVETTTINTKVWPQSTGLGPLSALEKAPGALAPPLAR